MPFVSIIIPTYNSLSFIEDAINSVLKQSYKDYEIICVDNNSTDGTLSKLNELNEANNNIFTVLSESKQGSNFARNKGLQFAHGEWIQFLDSDDILYPDKLKIQIDLVKDSDFDLVVGNYYYDIDKIRIKYEASMDYWTCLMKAEFGCTPSNLWRRSTLLRLGGWDDVQSSQEIALLFKYLKVESKIIVDLTFNCLVRKINSGSISNSNIKGNLQRSIELRIKIYNYLKDRELLTSEFKSATNSFVFDLLKAYYYYDNSMSINYYTTFYKVNFNPSKDKLNSFYFYLLKFFGFRNAQEISLFIKCLLKV